MERQKVLGGKALSMNEVTQRVMAEVVEGAKVPVNEQTTSITFTAIARKEGSEAATTNVSIPDPTGMLVELSALNNSVEAEPVNGLQTESILRYLQSRKAEIDYINIKSSSASGIDTQIKMLKASPQGTFETVVFEVSEQERNTQFNDKLQTIVMKPIKKACMDFNTGFLIPVPSGAGSNVTMTITVAFKAWKK